MTQNGNGHSNSNGVNPNGSTNGAGNAPAKTRVNNTPLPPPRQSLFGGIQGYDTQQEHPAKMLFDLPEEYTNIENLKKLIARSDIPESVVKPLSRMLALGEFFGSKFIPQIAGWYCVTRIGKERLGREEFVKAVLRNQIEPDSEDDPG